MSAATEIAQEEFVSELINANELPQLHCIHTILKIAVSGKMTGLRLRLFKYMEIRNSKEEKFYLVLRYQLESSLMVIANSTCQKSDFLVSAIQNIFPLIVDLINDFSWFESVLPGESDAELLRLISKCPEPLQYPHIPLNEQTMCFYVKKEDYAKILSRNIILPGGFEFRNLDPRFAEDMIDVLLHAQPGDVENVANRLTDLPGIAIFETSTNTLAAFIYNDGLLISHQYVYPKYRSIGLGRAVEVAICRTNIQKLDIMPAKHVAFRRPKVVEMSKKAGYWSLLADLNGNAVKTYWTIHSKTPKSTIEIYDN